MKIILDENDIYQAGQFVRGTIVINLTTDVPLTECSIRLYCVAEVGWTENPGIRDEGRSFHVQRKLLEMSYLPETPENCKKHFQMFIHANQYKCIWCCFDCRPQQQLLPNWPS